jgi:hypothetical protein
MKAEALFHLGQAGEALILVNMVRERANATLLTSLDGPLSFDPDVSIPGGELFNEIGREMFAENSKRQALIRWGLFTEMEKWVLPFWNAGDKIVTGEHTNLFPVHRDKLDANLNLDQNPGYNGR